MSQDPIFNYVQFDTRIATSGQPLENEFALIAQNDYKAVINIAMHNSDGFLPNEGYIVTKLGMSYFHIPVSFTKPTVEHLKLFIDLMACLENQKIWIHCAANFRVSAFMYLYQRYRYGSSEKDAKSSIFEFWIPDKTWQILCN